MTIGAALLTETIQKIFNGTATKKPQPQSQVTHAPKIFKPDCKIDWTKDALPIFNTIRGLSPYPTAYTVIKNEEEVKTLKIFKVDYQVNQSNQSGKIKIENDLVWIGCSNGWIIIHELQLEGKKRMHSAAFIKGFDFENWHAE